MMKFNEKTYKDKQELETLVQETGFSLQKLYFYLLKP